MEANQAPGGWPPRRGLQPVDDRALATIDSIFRDPRPTQDLTPPTRRAPSVPGLSWRYVAGIAASLVGLWLLPMPGSVTARLVCAGCVALVCALVAKARGIQQASWCAAAAVATAAVIITPLAWPVVACTAVARFVTGKEH